MKTTAEKKKPKEIEKEVKIKLIGAIEKLLFKNDENIAKKLRKVIKTASSGIAKKYVKAVKKAEKKSVNSKSPVSTKTTGQKSKSSKPKVKVAKTKKLVSSNGKVNGTVTSSGL